MPSGHASWPLGLVDCRIIESSGIVDSLGGEGNHELASKPWDGSLGDRLGSTPDSVH
jgi:hypothetical protein